MIICYLSVIILYILKYLLSNTYTECRVTQSGYNSYFCPSDLWPSFFYRMKILKWRGGVFIRQRGLFPRWWIKTSPLILQSEGDKKKEDINNWFCEGQTSLFVLTGQKDFIKYNNIGIFMRCFFEIRVAQMP